MAAQTLGRGGEDRANPRQGCFARLGDSTAGEAEQSAFTAPVRFETEGTASRERTRLPVACKCYASGFLRLFRFIWRAERMPNCFQLYPKGSNAPAILQDVDAAICQHFGAPVDPVHWFRDWYHCIGFLIAMKGHALGSPELRAEIIAWHEGDPAHYLAAQLAILDYLSAHYTSNAWVEIGRRATV